MHERTVETRKIFEGRVLALEVLEVELEDGRRSVREIIRKGGAVGVLTRAPDGRFLFVRQYRKAKEEYVVEVPAGINDPGEAPETAARRELREETGYDAATIRHLGLIYSSPGYTEEAIDLFYAECAPERHAADLDEDEHVEVVALTAGEVEEWIRDGRIRDAKTIAAWQYYGLKVRA